jgi:hypothetical protein
MSINEDGIDVQFVCRLCQQKGTAKVPHQFGGLLSSLKQSESPEEKAKVASLIASLENCARLLCHHRCYEIWELMRLAEHKMYFAAMQIGSVNERVAAAGSALMEKWFRYWCHNEARRFRVAPTEYWVPEFSGALASNPESLRDLLAEMRERIRKCQPDPMYWSDWENKKG